ncbi:NYN domain-containing protein [Acidobacteriota bacterium]
MAYLIDGNNLLGFLFPQNIRNPENRSDLIGQLLKFQVVKRTRVHLVFDGPPDPNLEEFVKTMDHFHVYFPDFGQQADHVIKKIILKVTDRRRYYVISSDREIRDFARTEGLQVLTCPEFSRELKKAKRDYTKIREEGKEDITLSRLEVDQWHDLFEKNR